jgi:hypothetical protein
MAESVVIAEGSLAGKLWKTSEFDLLPHVKK